MSAKLYTIPPSAPFADTLARGLIARVGDGPLALADSTIYLPTRRAQRTFGDAFARVLGGAALLPHFKALGDADDDELLFEPEAIDLPPAIAPMRRTLLLASLVQRFQDGGMGFAQAAALADSLAGVMDEMETQGAQLSALDSVIPGALAAHWERVRKFLGILETHWPSILAAEERISPADRRNRALLALAERIKTHPPDGPLIAAGSTGSIPATAELLKAIAEAPNGVVVLPGLDRALDRASWDNLDPGHPQFGMKQLLGRLGVSRDAVADWDGTRDGARERTLREAMRPAPTTDAWRALAEDNQAPAIADGANGLALIEAADASEEAAVIALVLREALEEPGKTATLVTPDRALARRVANELKRWEIDVDDSAGRPLSHTPPGTFLCLLAEAADEGFAPVPLLALLKHPLCTMGDEPGAFRARVRELDVLLRGPRPDPGLNGIARAIPSDRKGLAEWFADLAEALQQLETRDGDLATLVAAHLGAAETLAGRDLWKAEAGGIAGRFTGELLESARGIMIGAGAYAALFRRLASRQAVRVARSGHPRVAILGPLEARLQSFDTVVLGGLNEGSWPHTSGADPWFSRPMRAVMGLEQPERVIGQAAHDFAMLSAGPRVILTRAQKSEGVPAVASRWVQRLTQLTNGLGLKDVLKPSEDYIALAQSLRDAGPVERIKMPRPTPPVEARPTQLPVTDIEKWVRDPYAIYARRILGLRVLDPLDAAIGPLERGNAVHLVLERFVKEFPSELPPDAAARLCAIADEVFAEESTPKAVLALWRPRFARAAQWFVEMDAALRSSVERSITEIKGEMAVTPAFRLFGIADRIDLLPDGKGVILDYKTGQVPTQKQIESFLAPQLLLEAAMLAAGAFPGIEPREAEALLYLQISGGRVPGTIREVDVGLVAEALEKLRKRIADFARPETSYDPRLHPKQARVSGDYDHLARVREWSISGWEAPEE
ncbi:MAG TPA: double-strand break repair protein AddB [Rhizomicrobium sp.]|nr:double-strand break repair protein AddB [Rhizomicrobium sp.]